MMIAQIYGMLLIIILAVPGVLTGHTTTTLCVSSAAWAFANEWIIAPALRAVVGLLLLVKVFYIYPYRDVSCDDDILPSFIYRLPPLFIPQPLNKINIIQLQLASFCKHIVPLHPSSLLLSFLFLVELIVASAAYLSGHSILCEKFPS